MNANLLLKLTSEKTPNQNNFPLQLNFEKQKINLLGLESNNELRNTTEHRNAVQTTIISLCTSSNMHIYDIYKI